MVYAMNQRPSMRANAATSNRNDGMQAESASTGRLLEIACDESGSEGENLIGGETDVFAHASVALSTESATHCIEEMRRRIRSPALEYKANHLLRTKHRPVLEWLLESSGPIHGHAHVHLTDKTFFVIGKVIDLLVEGVPYSASIGRHQDAQARSMAVTLYREGRRAFGLERWAAFLESFVDLMRTTNRRSVGVSVDSFFRMVEDLSVVGTRGRAHEIMGLLCPARSHVDSFRAQLLDNPKMIPALDPLMPAIVQGVAYWSEDRNPVSIVHDAQRSLTEERIAQLKEVYGMDYGVSASHRFTEYTLSTDQKVSREEDHK